MKTRAPSVFSVRLRNSINAVRKTRETDGDLLARFIANRDGDAFAALVGRHGPMVLGVCRRVTGNIHLAEDAFQATLLVLARRAADIKPREAVRAWLYGVAVRTAHEALAMSNRRRTRECSLSVVPEAAAPMSEPVDPDALRALDEEIAKLPASLRAAVVMCELDGVSRRNAASRLGIPEGTLSSRLAKARKTLAVRLRRRGFGLPSAGLAALFTIAASGTRIRAELQALASRLAEPSAAPKSIAELVRGVHRSMLLRKLGTLVVAAAAVIASCLIAASTTCGSPVDDAPAKPATPMAAASVEPDLSKGQVEGIVVDEAGKPVAGAMVSVVGYYRSKPLNSNITAGDGSFHIELEQATIGYATLLASADHGRRQGIANTTEFDNGSLVKARIVLKPARSMQVRVVNGLSDPVLGAGVALFAALQVQPLFVGTTDREGNAVFQIPADMPLERVAALKSGVGFDYYENTRTARRTIPLPSPKSVELKLDGCRTVRIRAEDSEGKSLPNIRFIPLIIAKQGRLTHCNLGGAGMMDGATATTDKDGIATFDWIPLDLNQSVTFVSRESEWYEPRDAYFQPTLPDKPLVSQMLRLATVSGKVALADGKPAPGVLIEALGRGPGNARGGFARTRSDGTWTMQVSPNQTYVIGVISDDWAARSVTGLFLQEGSVRSGLDFHLTKGTIIRGKVTVGKDNKPAADQLVKVTESQIFVRRTKSDNDGNYQFRLADGSYEIEFAERTDDLKFKGPTTVERDFHLDRMPRGELRGTVRTADGKPVPNARVQGDPIAAPRHGGFNGIADAQGNYRASRWRDRMSVYACDATGNQAAMINIEPDTESADLTLAPAGSIHGRLVGRNGLPIAGARIYCQMSVGRGIDWRQVNLEVTTDDLGEIRLDGLIDGSDCRIAVYALDRSETLTPVKVKANDFVNLGRIEFPSK